MVTVTVDGEIIELEPESVGIEKEVVSAGRSVDVLDINNVPVVILK
jgi:valyl-tRNA synthetase